MSLRQTHLKSHSFDTYIFYHFKDETQWIVKTNKTSYLHLYRPNLFQPVSRRRYISDFIFGLMQDMNQLAKVGMILPANYNFRKDFQSIGLTIGRPSQHVDKDWRKCLLYSLAISVLWMNAYQQHPIHLAFFKSSIKH